MVLSRHHKVAIAGAMLLAGLLAGAGCGSVLGYLNPEFVQTLGLGTRVATVPGEAPAVVLEVQNSIDRVIEFRATWRDSQSEIHERTRTLLPGETYSEALICPITEMTLGDVSNLDATGAIVRLGGGTSADPFVEVEAFGVLLQEGINYDCGDSVTFTILSSSATLSGYQVFAFIRRSDGQTGG